MQKPFEQQHQNDVDAQHANGHCKAKAGKQFVHDFGITHLNNLYAWRQTLQGG